VRLKQPFFSPARWVPIVLSLAGANAGAQARQQGFPAGFDWCAATAGHQIEGQNTASDWWRFEETSGRIARGERSGRASNSWELFSRDQELLTELHATQYRFSVEWSRVEPRPGEIDQRVVERYRSLVDGLEARGISPFVTLQHFTMPQWLRERGGWEWSGSAQAFASFARLVRERIAPRARYFVTINEPMVNLLGGYYLGVVPPVEKRSLPEVVPVITGMLRAHVAAYRELHAGGGPVRVGMAHHLRVFEGRSRFNPVDRVLAGLLERAWNWSVPEALESGVFKLSLPGLVRARKKVEGLAGTQDYFGLNYYTREKVDSGLLIRSALGRSSEEDRRRIEAMYTPESWEDYPQGLESLLGEVHVRYPHREIRVTENGVADSSDLRRQNYLREHLSAVARAVRRGARVRGYCHWSLLDNFEWIHGFQPRFGLFAVDYRTFERSARPSVRVFADFAQKNAVW
jgi:beta-glucosidase